MLGFNFLFSFLIIIVSFFYKKRRNIEEYIREREHLVMGLESRIGRRQGGVADGEALSEGVG